VVKVEVLRGSKRRLMVCFEVSFPIVSNFGAVSSSVSRVLGEFFFNADSSVRKKFCFSFS
jgi:hypothetical protein